MEVIIYWRNNERNVTSEWDGFFLEQVRTNNGQYIMIFSKDMLEIHTSSSLIVDNTNPLPGKYKPYSVLKNDDTYTIKVKGKGGFTYTLNKVAPRKFIGEDGLEYSTSLYLE